MPVRPLSGFTPDTGATVEIDAGRVRGHLLPDSRVRVWRGVPYAAPPVGALRFGAPEPVQPWPGERDATANGRSPVQPAQGLRPGPLKVWLGARRGRSEDCLYLNVWAPASAGALRPVVVWIHGGGFVTGTGADYDCSQLAGDGDVVMVTVSYRLGGLGFIDFAAPVGGDDPRIVSNPGLRDQIAALEWVHRNIAAFGGDPGRVTLAGESAGSAAVCALATAPAARGLFHGVIAQSGALTLAVDRDDAARTARQILGDLNVSRERIEELWQRPASAILAATSRAQDTTSGRLVTRPWWDGDVLPPALEAAYDAVDAVPFMIGSNADEHRTFTRIGKDIMPMTRDRLATHLVESFGWDHARRVLAEYPHTPDGLNDLGSDFVFGMPSVHLAERQAERAPVWRYRMDLQSWLPGMGAFHAIELMLLFPTSTRAEWMFIGPPSAGRDALAQRFRDHWLAFVRDGSPGADWPAYEPTGKRTALIWNLVDRLESDPNAARRLAWAGGDAKIH